MKETGRSFLDDAPVLHEHLVIVWDCFQDLHVARNVSFGGPLPITEAEILAWLMLRKIENVDTRIAIRDGVRVLDNCWYTLRRDDNANN